MMNNTYFDMTRDKQFPYFCRACLIGRSEVSLDQCYCPDCCELLLNEANNLNSRDKPKWMPRSQKVKYMSGDGMPIMSTVRDKKSEVDIFQLGDAKVLSKRGPKQRVLPEELIVQWGNGGMGSKAIVARLKAEKSIKVSYKTIQRILSGKRV